MRLFKSNYFLHFSKDFFIAEALSNIAPGRENFEAIVEFLLTSIHHKVLQKLRICMIFTSFGMKHVNFGIFHLRQSSHHLEFN